MNSIVKSLLLLAMCLSAGAAAAQSTDRPQPKALEGVGERAAGAPDYRIGADDQLSVSVLQAPELNATARVSEQGSISLPLLGLVRVGGLSLLEAEAAIEDLLGRKYIRNPEVTVQVTDVRSRSVSVVGAVQRPGIIQIRESTTLLEVLSLAGGLTDDAGETVIVLQKPADQAAAIPREVKLKTLMDTRDPHLNVAIHPGDVVNVRSAETFYVVGAVKKSGAFVMRGNERLTVLRALALGEGFAPGADRKDALVVRTGPNGERVEIPVDLDSLLKGRSPDVALQAQDILFVPTSGGRVAARTAFDTFVRILSWRPF